MSKSQIIPEYIQLSSEKHICFKKSEIDELTKKLLNVKNAMDSLVNEIVSITTDKDNTSLIKLMKIRQGKEGEKSTYECLNQLIHYYYCLKAAIKLFGEEESNSIKMLPTAHDSNKRDKHCNKNCDIEVLNSDDEVILIAEVFCVSESSFKGKFKKTMDSLIKDSRTCTKMIFCNDVMDTITIKKPVLSKNKKAFNKAKKLYDKCEIKVLAINSDEIKELRMTSSDKQITYNM